MSDFIYGVHAVSAVLERAADRALCLWVVTGIQSGHAMSLIEQAQEHGVAVKRVSNDALAQRTGEAVHQGIALAVKPRQTWGEADWLAHIERELEVRPNLAILVLDGVQDPRNLGACLRSAAAFGLSAVVAPKRRSAALTASAEKVACGGASFVPFVTVTNLSRVLKKLQDLGIWVVGTDANASLSLQEVDLKGPVALVMGSEGDGVRDLTAKTCDYLAKIPMTGALPSLNVSAAATVCLYERQRQQLA